MVSAVDYLFIIQIIPIIYRNWYSTISIGFVLFEINYSNNTKCRLPNEIIAILCTFHIFIAIWINFFKMTVAKKVFSIKQWSYLPLCWLMNYKVNFHFIIMLTFRMFVTKRERKISEVRSRLIKNVQTKESLFFHWCFVHDANAILLIMRCNLNFAEECRVIKIWKKREYEKLSPLS